MPAFLSFHKPPRNSPVPGYSLFLLLLLGWSISKNLSACSLILLGSLPIFHVLIEVFHNHLIKNLIPYTTYFFLQYLSSSNVLSTLLIFVFCCLTPHNIISLLHPQRYTTVWHIKKSIALAGVTEHRPENQRVARLIPTQGTCLDCGLSPQWGLCERQPHIDASLLLCFLPFPTL